ncbi:MAG: archease [Candidatus Thermoplasmatota archaeon]|nr:archease [Candidatus Thermoplasmatota archaeon]MDI6887014.1 archease [Candidatus Thermoplasmatota archaeon]
MKKYSFIEHTADIAIRAYGKNLDQCFENAAFAMFDIISDTKKVKTTGEYKIELKAESLEQLLVDWLSKLLYLHDSNNFLFGKFRVALDKERKNLRAQVWGEKFDRNRHFVGKEIKAVTYHMLEVNEKDCYVQVLFDI